MHLLMLAIYHTVCIINPWILCDFKVPEYKKQRNELVNNKEVCIR